METLHPARTFRAGRDEMRDRGDRLGRLVRPGRSVRAAASERGQTTVTLAAVLALAVLLAGLLTTIASGMLHRQRAQTAADAIALAAATEDAAIDELVAWYSERNIVVEHGDGHVVAVSGPAAAEAWATMSDDRDVRALPALVAIIARAEQLTGGPYGSVRVIGDRVELNLVDASRLRLVAGEIGLCERTSAGSLTHTIFGLC